MRKDEWKYFGSNVKKIRTQHNLSRSAMAEMLELSVELLDLLESGIVTEEMDVRILEHIYMEFGIKPSELFAESLSS